MESGRLPFPPQALPPVRANHLAHALSQAGRVASGMTARVEPAQPEVVQSGPGGQCGWIATEALSKKVFSAISNKPKRDT